jgi:hypothetical protein
MDFYMICTTVYETRAPVMIAALYVFFVFVCEVVCVPVMLQYIDGHCERFYAHSV